MLIYLLSFFSLLCVFFLFYKKRSTLVFLPIVLFALFYLPGFFDVFFGNYKYHYNVISSANLFALIVNFFILSTSIVFFQTNNINDRNLLDFNINKLPKDHLLKFFLLISFFSLLLALKGVHTITNGNILSYSWANKHSDAGGGIWLLISSYLFILSSGIVFLSFLLKKNKIFLLSLFLVVLYIILIRSRGFVVPVVMVFLFYYLCWKRKVLSSFLIGCLFLFLFFILQQVRYLGELNNLNNIELSVMIENIKNKIMEEDSEFSLRNSFYYFIQQYDYLLNNFDFGNFQTYRRIVFFFDGFDLGLKPKDFTNTMYKAYYGESLTLSNPTLHPTLYGSIYANGLYISAILFSIIVYLFLKVEFFLKKNGLTVYWLTLPCLIYSCIFIARGSIYNAFLVLLINVIFIYFFVRFFEKITILNKRSI